MERVGGSVDNVVMVSGQHWHDAMVAVPMAAALGAPVVLTPPGSLRDDTMEFLARAGAKHVIVVATGTWPDTAVSSRVHAELEDAGLTVFLTHGADRYHTGVAVARWLARLPSHRHGGSAIIASGETFADALVAGPLAYKARAPLLLTPSNELHPAVAAFLKEAGIGHVVVMGGTAAVSATVETAIEALGIASVERIAGADRYHTAVATARYAATRFAGNCFDGSNVGLVRGDLAFDSAAAAPLLAQNCAPLLLSHPDQLPAAATQYLDGVRRAAQPNPIAVSVFGGTAAVSQHVLDRLAPTP